MKKMGSLLRIVLAVVAALLAAWILVRAWEAWTFPPCAGPQHDITLCQ